MKEMKGNLIGKGKRFAIIVSRFNELISRRLIDGATDCLLRPGVADADIDLVWTPGSYEIPFVANRLIDKGYNGLICLGAVIRGDTPHFDYIASEVAKGIAQLNLKGKVPVSFGIITADNIDQAINRAGAKEGNKGWDAALSALEMANIVDIV
ncbi:MAG TPA: 6,7-dimethyl-8-ribityllumazine synthase [bacterium (Candidatus Stahlbacteria)]|nr:6,7-dimethyl-8-ribityllumazine synthase [Candidatus Stahlbacteria bacterium]